MIGYVCSKFRNPSQFLQIFQIVSLEIFMKNHENGPNIIHFEKF